MRASAVTVSRAGPGPGRAYRADVADATDFLIVQHAQKASAPGDVGLSPAGQAQAAQTARRLAGLPIAAVYASPLRRSRETAAPIARVADRPIVEDDRLRERMNWDGEGSLDTFLSEWARATSDRGYVPRWGESSIHVGERFAALLHELGRRHRGELVILVGHGGAAADLLRTLLGDDRVRAAAPGIVDHGVPNCAVTHLRLADGRIEPVTIAAGLPPAT